MAREWRTKTFKSGNSVAVRLPKAAGFCDGDDVTLVAHADGSISFWKQEAGKAMFARLYGSMSAGWMAAGRDDIDQSEYAWDEMPSAAA